MSSFNLKKWILLNFMGWFVGVFFIIALSGVLDSIGIEHMQFYVGAGMGTGIGLIQWWLMKDDLKIRFNWVLTSILVLTTPFVVFDFVIKDDATRLLPSVIIGSLLLGGAHYYLLKSKVKSAIIWWPLSSIGWIFSVLAVASVNYTKYVSDSNLILFFLNLFLILSGGVILGISTGIAMKNILKRNNQ